MMIILVSNHNMFWRARNPIDSLIEQNNECIQVKSKMASEMASKMADGYNFFSFGAMMILLVSSHMFYVQFEIPIKSRLIFHEESENGW